MYVKETSGGSSGSGMTNANCPKDEQVVGGGGRISGDAGEARLVESGPRDDGDDGFVPDDDWWTITHNIGGTQKSVQNFAICRG